MSLGEPQGMTPKAGLRAIWLGFAAALFGSDPGAALCGQRVSRPVFSPDSRTLAFTSTTNIAHVCWCDVKSPKHQKQVRIVQVDRDFEGGNLFQCIHKVFSPDSRSLAVASPAGLDVIDLRTMEKQRLTGAGEIVSALYWTDKDKVVYVAHSRQRGLRGSTTDRTFWRQRTNVRRGARRAIYTEKQVTTEMDYFMWQVESFSPDGRYAIFGEETEGSPLKLLDLSDGTVKKLPPRRSVRRMGIAWKPDGSAAVCIDYGAPSYLAFLVNPRTGETWKFGKQFTESFVVKGDDRRGALDVPQLVEIAWTPDGKYLIVNNPCRGGYLLRLRPWRVFDLGRRFGWVFARSETMASLLMPLPVPGWVGAWGPEGEWYAVDYAGRRFYRLLGQQHSGLIPPAGPSRPALLWTGGSSWAESRAMSPDGKLTAEVDPSREVTLQKVQLPALRPATRPAPKIGEPEGRRAAEGEDRT